MPTYRRISKREAIKRFWNNELVTLCPCKLRPGPPFGPDITIHPKEWREHSTLVHRDEQRAWADMYNNWAYYNTSYEAGYYAHYYIVAD